MIEVEAKIKITDPKELEHRIKALGGQFRIETLQKDIYFNAPHRDLIKSKEVLRLREENGQFILTYKSPNLDTSKSKARPEIELKISDLEAMKSILEHLGFSVVAEVKKHRRSYIYEEIEIGLDEVESLGTFVEISTFVKDKKELETARQSIEAIMQKLGLSKDHLEEKSYLEMLLSS